MIKGIVGIEDGKSCTIVDEFLTWSSWWVVKVGGREIRQSKWNKIITQDISGLLAGVYRKDWNEKEELVPKAKILGSNQDKDIQDTGLSFRLRWKQALEHWQDWSTASDKK